MSNRGLKLAMIAAFACGCNDRTPAHSEPPPPACDSAGPDGGLADRVHELQPKVEAMFDRSFARPLAIGTCTSDELAIIRTRELDETWTPADAKAWGEVGEAFSFYPRTTDLRAIYGGLAGRVLGYYDFPRKMLHLVTDNSAQADLGAADRPGRDETLFHEMVHAMQDQIWDLSKFSLTSDNADRDLARRAVIEGDATVRANRFLHGHFNNIKDRLWSGPIRCGVDVPLMICGRLEFPYREGMRFVLAVAAARGESGVRGLFVEPPQSTEQVLHPERYLDRDPPVDVVLDLDENARKLDTSWARVGVGTIGEHAIRMLFATHGLPEVGASAGAGWGGDRYAVYVHRFTARLALIWRTVWDSADDALEFELAYRELLRRTHGGAPVVIERRDREVLIHQGALRARDDVTRFRTASPQRSSR